MKKNPHALTIVCHAKTPEALIGTVREALEELEEGLEAGIMTFSGILQGGSENSNLQGFYMPPCDFDFTAHIPDSPDLPPVETSDEVASQMPPDDEDGSAEVEAFVSLLKEMFPGANISVSKLDLDDLKGI